MIAEEKFKNYGIIDTDITAVVMQVDKKQESAYSLPVITTLRCQLKEKEGKKSIAFELLDGSIMVIDSNQIKKLIDIKYSL